MLKSLSRKSHHDHASIQAEHLCEANQSNVHEARGCELQCSCTARQPVSLLLSLLTFEYPLTFTRRSHHSSVFVLGASFTLSMAAVPFGFSVGDFVASIELIHNHIALTVYTS